MKQKAMVMLGVLTSAVIFASSGYASTGLHNIRASFANIKLVVNNKVVKTSAEPFIYNKNVYVPISAVAHALQASAKWVNRPAGVFVQNNVRPVTVYDNGQKLPSGITDGSTFYDVPATDAAYVKAFGLTPTMDNSGNVSYEAQTPPSFALNSTALMSLTPTNLIGDFSNSQLYPGGQLSGYWPATVLGTMYPGQFTIEWAVTPGQKAVVPGVDYNLQGKYTMLSGSFAIDDLSKNFNGSIQLTFVGDGKTLGSTGYVQTGQQAVPISIPVTGVQNLEIQYQVKDANGTVTNMGNTYTAPSVNQDGSKTDPVFVVDFMNAALQ